MTFRPTGFGPKQYRRDGIPPYIRYLKIGGSMEHAKTFYRRHLPHFQPAEATYFITFRLAGSLPVEVIEKFKEEKKLVGQLFAKRSREKGIKNLIEKRWDHYFDRFDSLLNGNDTGPLWLQDPKVAKIVKDAIHFRDEKIYDLIAYCIMPNHVHMVFVGRNDIPTYRVLQSLKRYTARHANQILNRSGPFWQNESYDHVIRDANELERIIWYVLNNPVKAKLVSLWKEWPWVYCEPGIVHL